MIDLNTILQEIEKIEINERSITKMSVERKRNRKNRWIRRVGNKFKFCSNKKQILGKRKIINEEIKLRRIGRQLINDIVKQK